VEEWLLWVIYIVEKGVEMEFFTWQLTVVSIVGVVANIYHKRWCFYLWMYTNFAWAMVDLYYGIYAQSILFGVYFGLAVVGAIKWGKEKRHG